jgi:hypothetical protein
MEKLTGNALRAKVAELHKEGVSAKDVLTRKTGYVATKEDGTERLLYSAFRDAYFAATAGFVPTAQPGVRAGRELSFVAKVQKNGQLIIGPGYLTEVKIGAKFKITISDVGEISLTPLPAETETETETEGGAGT